LENDHLEDQDRDWTIILKCILHCFGNMDWIGAEHILWWAFMLVILNL